MLLPHLVGVEVERVEQVSGGVRIAARASVPSIACPDCGVLSARVHSRYGRRLADVAVGGQRAVIVLEVRRLFCDTPGCRRRTFAEQVPGLTVPYGRRAPVLREALEKIAVALAGRAGARLARGLCTRVSRSTMLRLVMAMPDPVWDTPRVLGVDDFAFKKGQVYGTIIIDCETGAPLDLLDGRDAQPLADWLTTHPGVEIICRDRSGSYAEGARTGAPGAVQCADRFHLWQNLGKAVERCVARHRSCLSPAAGDPCERADETEEPIGEVEQADPVGKFADRIAATMRSCTIWSPRGTGCAIARQLGWGRHTVQRYARAATRQEMADGKWKQTRAASRGGGMSQAWARPRVES